MYLGLLNNYLRYYLNLILNFFILKCSNYNNKFVDLLILRMPIRDPKFGDPKIGYPNTSIPV